MVTRRKFSKELKAEAVRLVRELGVSIVQVAADLDVHANVLCKWVRAVAADAVSRSNTVR